MGCAILLVAAASGDAWRAGAEPAPQAAGSAAVREPLATFAPQAISGAQTEAWRTSPFHGVTSGATGKPIPCLCRFRGQDFKLGDQVCMQTPDGIGMTRCDMLLNNTTWVPTGQSCTMSMRSPAPQQSRQS